MVREAEADDGVALMVDEPYHAFLLDGDEVVIAEEPLLDHGVVKIVG